MVPPRAPCAHANDSPSRAPDGAAADGSQPSDAGTEPAASQSQSQPSPLSPDRPVAPPRAPGAGAEEQSRKRSRGSPSVVKRATVAWGGGKSGLSRQISIDRLPEEGKRIDGLGGGFGPPRREPSVADGPHEQVLRALLRPDDWTPPPPNSRFQFSLRTVRWLCDEARAILALEPTVVDVRAPAKVFGDIHGQFGDLMRLFREYGAPWRDDGPPRSPTPRAAHAHAAHGAGHGGGGGGGGGAGGAPSPATPQPQRRAAGDLVYADYVFLGDYVDRGSHSLETLCLLLALKVRHPARVVLLRGNHELPDVNSRDGFLLECVQRFESREAGVQAWKCFNELFCYLPLAAVINNVILCLHGGIGASLNQLEQLRRLQRPLRIDADTELAPLLLDVLWSDPTEHDSVEGVHPNHERGDPVVRYGPDRVRSFLRLNGLKLLIRGHECVMDGFQRFAGGLLLTVFSATDYCGVCGNAGALIIVGKELECVPKLIYPCEELEDAWLRADQMRPPTPPRSPPPEEAEAGGGAESDARKRHAGAVRAIAAAAGAKAAEPFGGGGGGGADELLCAEDDLGTELGGGEGGGEGGGFDEAGAAVGAQPPPSGLESGWPPPPGQQAGAVLAQRVAALSGAPGLARPLPLHARSALSDGAAAFAEPLQPPPPGAPLGVPPTVVEGSEEEGWGLGGAQAHPRPHPQQHGGGGGALPGASASAAAAGAGAERGGCAGGVCADENAPPPPPPLLAASPQLRARGAALAAALASAAPERAASEWPRAPSPPEAVEADAAAMPPPPPSARGAARSGEARPSMPRTASATLVNGGAPASPQSPPPPSPPAADPAPPPAAGRADGSAAAAGASAAGGVSMMQPVRVTLGCVDACTRRQRPPTPPREARTSH